MNKLKAALVAVLMAAAVAFGGANTALAADGCAEGQMKAVTLLQKIESEMGVDMILIDGDEYKAALADEDIAGKISPSTAWAGVLIAGPGAPDMAGVVGGPETVFHMVGPDGCTVGEFANGPTDILAQIAGYDTNADEDSGKGV